MLLIGDDEREERHRLAGSRGHLQNAVSTRVEGLLEITHVCILLWIYPRIREEHREVIDEELHIGWLAGGGLRLPSEERVSVLDTRPTRALPLFVGCSSHEKCQIAAGAQCNQCRANISEDSTVDVVVEVLAQLPLHRVPRLWMSLMTSGIW